MSWPPSAFQQLIQRATYANEHRPQECGVAIGFAIESFSKLLVVSLYPKSACPGIPNFSPRIPYLHRNVVWVCRQFYRLRLDLIVFVAAPIPRKIPRSADRCRELAIALHPVGQSDCGSPSAPPVDVLCRDEDIFPCTFLCTGSAMRSPQLPSLVLWDDLTIRLPPFSAAVVARRFEGRLPIVNGEHMVAPGCLVHRLQDPHIQHLHSRGFTPL